MQVFSFLPDLILSSGHASFIPEGTRVFMSLYALQRDPRYFSPAPDKFWPERWLEESSSVDKLTTGSTLIHNTEAFIPFSFGPAHCIGKQLAYREMRIVIASMLQKFDICFEKGYNTEQWLDDLRDEFLLVKGKLPVVLQARF